MTLTQEEFDRRILSDYPDFPWGEPIPVSLFGFVGGEPHYACRLCVLRNGLKGSEVNNLPTDIEVVRQHIAEHHGIP